MLNIEVKTMNVKSEIIKILEKNRNTVISGQDLANQLNVSRMSVCKAIKALKEDGYELISIPNKGYKLLNESDVLSKEAISCYLNKKINIYTYKTVDSTNNETKKIAVDNKKEDALIVSEHQSAGRGRYGRNFYSPAKQGIYMSLLLHCHKSFNDATLITIQSAVAIWRVIKRLYQIDTKIKWVNDLYYHGKKICGILTEGISDFESQTMEAVIIGIGINISTSEFPEELLNKAASLNLNNINRNELIANIVNEILIVIEEDFNKILNEYKNASCVINKEIEFIYKGQIKQGHVIDINETGNLIVQTANQKLTLNAGDIKIIGANYE